MKQKKILKIIIKVCISLIGLLAVLLCIYLASRFIYNKSFKETKNDSVATPLDISAERASYTDAETTGEDTAGKDTAGKDTTEVTAKKTTEETTGKTTEETTTEKAEDVLNDSAEHDVTPPVLLVLNKEPYIRQWENFDIHKYIGYADDWDRTPDFSVDKDVDTSTIGDYPLKITISDDAGNTTDAAMTVHVVSTIPENKPRPTIYFEDFLNNYKNSKTEIGIDVSRWQGTIDFNQVKAAGCEFAIIRIGGYDDGSVYVDSNYYTNMKNAKTAGLKVGIYYHAEERSVEEVKQNVKWLMGVLGEEKLDYPIAYDWEDFENFEKYEINLHDINDIYQTFYDEITSYGYDAMLYSSKNYLQCLWTNEQKTPVWLAHYIDKTDYAGDYIMWQMGCTGRIPGISGDVDLNIMYK